MCKNEPSTLKVVADASRSEEHSYIILLLICCGVSFACYFASYMRVPVLPLFASSLGAGTVEVGAINACFLLMAGLLSIPLGIVSDRLGRRSLIIAGLALLAAASFLLWFSKSPLQLMAIHLLFGVGLAAFAPTMMSYVADFSPPTHLGRSYGWYTMAIYGGMTLGPAAGGFLGHLLGIPQVFMVAGALLFLVLLGVIPFLPVRQHKHPGPRKSAIISGKELLANRTYMGSIVGTVGSCFGIGVFVTFLPLLAKDRGLTAGGIGLIFASQALANAISRLPFGYLSDRIARRSILVLLGLAIFSISIAAIPFCQGIIGFIVVAAILGIGMGIAYTAIGALITETVSPLSRGLAMGGYNTSIYIGMMLSSAVMGVVIRDNGFTAGFVVTAAVTAAVTIIFGVMVRK